MLNKDRLQLLAVDVRIVADTANPGSFLAYKPGVANPAVVLSAVQAFLADGLRQPYSNVVLLAKSNARFPEKLSLDDLQKLIATLANAGLMTDGGQKVGGQSSTDPDNPLISAAGAEDDSSVDSSSPAGADEESERASYHNHWSLCKPQVFLDRTLQLIGFLRHFHFLVPLAFILAFVGLVKNLDLFFADIDGLKSHVSEAAKLLFSLFTISLSTQLYRGLAARHFGFATPSFGMMLVFGLLPRFNMRVTIPADAERRARLWVLGIPLYIRFIVFPLGFVIWLATRGHGNSLSLIGAGLVMVSIMSLPFVANPLLGGAGYSFLSAYFEVPNLRKKAFFRLKTLFSRQPSVVMQYVDRSGAVLAYGVLSILFSLLFLGFMAFLAARWLELNYQGFGVAIFLLVIVYLFFRFAYQGIRTRQQRQQAKSAVAAANALSAPSSPVQPAGFFSRVKLRRSHVFSLVLLGACFLPYQYESGGEANIFPVASAKIYADVPDLVQRIYFNGGELLAKGTVVAEMANDKQQHDVVNTREEILKKQEELNILLTTPSPEQIVMAQEELKKAELQLRYSLQDLERMESLYKNGYVSGVEYQDALQKVDLDRQLIKEARSNMDYVETQINEHQIEAAKIELSILRERLAYYQQVLDRTRLKMPIDGKIITMNLRNLQNSYLDNGVLFAEVEDASKVRVEIKITEGDIEEVAPGDAVQLRLLAYPNRVFSCEVAKVYPATEKDTFGRYLVSDCIIANEKYELKSGMTGFAKVEGKEMFAVTAFTRALVRFAKVEVWSWLP